MDLKRISSIIFIHFLDLTRSICEKCKIAALSYYFQLSRSNRMFMHISKVMPMWQWDAQKSMHSCPYTSYIGITFNGICTKTCA
jgi:hypothetical protein